MMNKAAWTSLWVGVLALVGACAWSPISGRQQAWAESVRPGIQWFATWESGLREAQRLKQPILLVAAAPHCAGVSGIW